MKSYAIIGVALILMSHMALAQTTTPSPGIFDQGIQAATNAFNFVWVQVQNGWYFVQYYLLGDHQGALITQQNAAKTSALNRAQNDELWRGSCYPAQCYTGGGSCSGETPCATVTADIMNHYAILQNPAG